MKKIYNISILLIIIISFNTSKAQVQLLGISVDANYPIPVGDNFIQEFYSGIVDIGASYRPLSFPSISAGVAANVGFLSGNVFDNDISVTMIRPRLSAEVNLLLIKPYIGVGYAWFIFGSDDIVIDDNTRQGPNINIGLKYNILFNVYINASYDYIYLDQGEGDDIGYNRSIQVVELGVGVSL